MNRGLLEHDNPRVGEDNETIQVPTRKALVMEQETLFQNTHVWRPQWYALNIDPLDPHADSIRWGFDKEKWLFGSFRVDESRIILLFDAPGDFFHGF